MTSVHAALIASATINLAMFVSSALDKRRANGWRNLYFELKGRAYLRDDKGRIAKAADVLK